LITAGLVLSKIKMADEGLRNFFGIDRPRIAVLGLNPIAARRGSWERKRKRRFSRPSGRPNLRAQCGGALSCDSFLPCRSPGHVDAVVSMYHDQGLIAMKMVDAREAVNVTLGLPFIRTSVAHGTAYDIAGGAWRIRPILSMRHVQLLTYQN